MTRRELLSLALLPLVQLSVAAPIVTTDIVGTPRPQGRAYDIGAYEFIGTAQVAKPLQPLGTKIVK